MICCHHTSTTLRHVPKNFRTLLQRDLWRRPQRDLWRRPQRDLRRRPQRDLPRRPQRDLRRRPQRDIRLRPQRVPDLAERQKTAMKALFEWLAFLWTLLDTDLVTFRLSVNYSWHQPGDFSLFRELFLTPTWCTTYFVIFSNILCNCFMISFHPVRQCWTMIKSF